MFTTRKLEEIDALLQEGLTPEDIAGRLGMTPGAFRYRLSRSGRDIKTFRRLVITSPADSPRERRELAAA